MIIPETSNSRNVRHSIQFDLIRSILLFQLLELSFQPVVFGFSIGQDTFAFFDGFDEREPSVVQFADGLGVDVGCWDVGGSLAGCSGAGELNRESYVLMKV